MVLVGWESVASFVAFDVRPIPIRKAFYVRISSPLTKERTTRARPSSIGVFVRALAVGGYQLALGGHGFVLT